MISQKNATSLVSRISIGYSSVYRMQTPSDFNSHLPNQSFQAVNEDDALGDRHHSLTVTASYNA